MVLFTKLLTNKFDEKWEELILSMVLFTKLLTPMMKFKNLL